MPTDMLGSSLLFQNPALALRLALRQAGYMAPMNSPYMAMLMRAAPGLYQSFLANQAGSANPQEAMASAGGDLLQWLQGVLGGGITGVNATLAQSRQNLPGLIGQIRDYDPDSAENANPFLQLLSAAYSGNEGRGGPADFLSAFYSPTTPSSLLRSANAALQSAVENAILSYAGGGEEAARSGRDISSYLFPSQNYGPSRAAQRDLELSRQVNPPAPGPQPPAQMPEDSGEPEEGDVEDLYSALAGSGRTRTGAGGMGMEPANIRNILRKYPALARG